MIGLLRVIRGFCGIFFVMQLWGVLSVFPWILQPDAATEEMWPMNLLDEGRFVNDFPGVKVYVGKKVGSQLEDFILYQFNENGACAEIRAKSGQVSFNPETSVMEISLDQFRLWEFDKDNPEDMSKVRTLSADHYPISLDLSQMPKKGTLSKKPVLIKWLVLALFGWLFFGLRGIINRMYLKRHGVPHPVLERNIWAL